MALVAFTVVGVLTHGASVGALFRDLALFLGCWFAVAVALKLYRRPSRARLLATWLVGISAAVLIRAAIVGHFAADFYGVALGFTLLFVLSGRRIQSFLARDAG